MLFDQNSNPKLPLRAIRMTYINFHNCQVQNDIFIYPNTTCNRCHITVCRINYKFCFIRHLRLTFNTRLLFLLHSVLHGGRIGIFTLGTGMCK